jgi:hypothetical protein
VPNNYIARVSEGVRRIIGRRRMTEEDTQGMEQPELEDSELLGRYQDSAVTVAFGVFDATQDVRVAEVTLLSKELAAVTLRGPEIPDGLTFQVTTGGVSEAT